MPTPTTAHRPGERLANGDRIRVHPANGADAYGVTLTDLGAWGITARLGARLIFLPWSAVDLVERIDAEAEPKPMRLPDEPEWCEAIVRLDEGGLVELCDLRLDHGGLHRGTISGRRFAGGDR